MTDAADPSLFPPGRLPAGAEPPRRLTLTLPDGYETVAYLHQPAIAVSSSPSCPSSSSPRLPVLYLHGIQSHPAWFAGSAAALAARGYPVYQVTRRGSGENKLARGHAASARQLVDDVEAAVRFVRKETGAAQLHLLGVSWGGKLLAAYAVGASREDANPGAMPFSVCGEGHGPQSTCPSAKTRKRMAPNIASLMLVAPGIVPLVDLSLGRKIAVGLSAAFCPRREFEIPLGDPSLFTDNPAMQEYIRRDGLSLRRATARFLLVSRLLDRAIARAGSGAISMPTTLILSNRDRIIDSAATADVVCRLTAGRCKIVELVGAHTLEFEEDASPLHHALCTSLDSARNS